MGAERPTPLIDQLYRRYLLSECSAAFVDAVAAHYSLATLVKLVRCGQPVTRRAATLAVGFLGDFEVNETLGQALANSDRAVRVLAEHGIRQVWFRQGDSDAQRLLRQCARHNQRGQFSETIALATDVMDSHHGLLAEAFHQRGIALYSLSNFEAAIADFRETIYLNRYHFLAAIGLANCHLQLDDVGEALASFRLSLSLHPDLEAVRGQISRLAKIVED